MVVDGDAAAAVGRARALEAAEAAGCCRPGRHIWPRRVEPVFVDVDVGVIRTAGAVETKEDEIAGGARSSRRLRAERPSTSRISTSRRAVAAARGAHASESRARGDRDHVARAARLARGRDERYAGRQLFMAVFDGPTEPAYPFLHPFARGLPGDEEYAPANKHADGTYSIHIHSKVLIIDDAFLRVGSSNLANRSMGFDTECDLGLEARSAAQRAAIAGVRNRLVAEHWGLEPKDVERALASGKPVVAALAAAQRGSPGSHRRETQRARDVASVEREDVEASEILIELGDPESAVTAERIAQRLDPVRGRPLLKWTLGMTAAAVLVLAAVALLRYLPSGGSGFVERATSALAALRGSSWGVPIVLLAFAVGSIVSFPILVLIGATVLALGPWLGFACAALGTLMAASITFWLGRKIGRRPLRRWLGRRAQLLERRLERRGIVAVALIRKVPIVPFTLVNMLIGASGLTYRDFIVGTAIGMLPGLRRSRSSEDERPSSGRIRRRRMSRSRLQRSCFGSRWSSVCSAR
jgi:uncharacterized membrane protein YdjX (TVP38/TMEM64 family)